MKYDKEIAKWRLSAGPLGELISPLRAGGAEAQVQSERGTGHYTVRLGRCGVSATRWQVARGPKEETEGNRRCAILPIRSILAHSM